MDPPARPLAGRRIGLSVSGDGAELAHHGFTPSGMNRFTVRLARALLAEGATLAFGHDWRPEGVMEAVAALAFEYHRPVDAEREPAAILNLIPWPTERSSTDPNLLLRLHGIVEVRPAGCPEELRSLEEEARHAGADSELYRYLRARGLTHLRRQLNEACDARVALGGKLSGYDGRLPGILEEVLLALQSHRPVYLVGVLGGAAQALGHVLLDGEDPGGLLREARLEELYRLQAARGGQELGDPDLNPERLRQELREPELRARLLANGLSEAENRRLLDSTLEEEVVLLILKGLKAGGRETEE
ncbi:MAG TPA: hypothetical protein VF017_09370 [Thermoanaerobaculia bacterium]|nr:hypothetical protein [Thermoanaerobaculia bacterium]